MRKVTSINNSFDYPRSESRSPSPAETQQQKVIEELTKRFSSAQSHQPEPRSESDSNKIITLRIMDEVITLEIMGVMQRIELVERLNNFYKEIMGIIVGDSTASAFNEAQQILAIKTAYEKQKKLLQNKPMSQPAKNSSKQEVRKVLLEVPRQELRSHRLRSPRRTVNRNRKFEVITNGNQSGFFNGALTIDTTYQDHKSPSQGCPKICSVM